MQQAGVPLVPGYHGAAQSAEALAVEAERIGYPVMIKPSAGGGGKDMRVVQRQADFVEALQAPRREAKAAFGDAQHRLERYLTAPRHTELQLVRQQHGTAAHPVERNHPPK